MVADIPTRGTEYLGGLGSPHSTQSPWFDTFSDCSWLSPEALHICMSSHCFYVQEKCTSGLINSSPAKPWSHSCKNPHSLRSAQTASPALWPGCEWSLLFRKNIQVEFNLIGQCFSRDYNTVVIKEIFFKSSGKRLKRRPDQFTYLHAKGEMLSEKRGRF